MVYVRFSPIIYLSIHLLSMINKILYKSPMVALAEARSKDKENPFLKYVHVTVRTNYCHIHEGRGLMLSTYHKVAGWFTQGVVPLHCLALVPVVGSLCTLKYRYQARHVVEPVHSLYFCCHDHFVHSFSEHLSR